MVCSARPSQLGWNVDRYYWESKPEYNSGGLPVPVDQLESHAGLCRACRGGPR